MVLQGGKMKDVVLEEVPCILGCPKNDELILTGQDRLHGLPGDFTMVKCRTCGLMRTNPRPNSATMGFYYPDDYRPYLSTRVNTIASREAPRSLPALSRAVQQIFEAQAYRLPTIPVGRLLEFGCASGSFLHRMAALGWYVEGIEVSEKSAGLARQYGYQVHVGLLEDTPPPSSPFNLIVGWMVLEHLHDPVKGLMKLREWATDDAYLVLAIPNLASWDFRIFKTRWYALQLPCHLWHFTPQTVSNVLSTAGWKIERIHYQRVLTDWYASLGYLLNDKGFIRLGNRLVTFARNQGRWRYALFPVAWLMALMGISSRITVWARKAK